MFARPSFVAGSSSCVSKAHSLHIPPAQSSVTQSVRAVTTCASELRQPRTENVPGHGTSSFYVDHTCIDCDTCRWMAPATFGRVGEMSAVVSQPTTAEDRKQALQALLSCPTFSIGVRHREPNELREAQEGMPIPVEGCSGVYHCGFASEASYAGAAWFIQRPGGNILVDSPRYNPVLARRLEELGAPSLMLLTHQDDVADHAKWAAHFGLKRIIHKSEVNKRQSTDAAEIQLTGLGPWRLGEEGICVAEAPNVSDDVCIIHTPGHTSGSISLLFMPSKALFTGDHMSWSWRLKRLSISRAYNWYSIPEQLKSVHKLLDYDWLHVLPGHGRPFHAAEAAARLKHVSELLSAEGFQV